MTQETIQDRIDVVELDRSAPGACRVIDRQHLVVMYKDSDAFHKGAILANKGNGEHFLTADGQDGFVVSTPDGYVVGVAAYQAAVGNTQG